MACHADAVAKQNYRGFKLAVATSFFGVLPITLWGLFASDERSSAACELSQQNKNGSGAAFGTTSYVFSEKDSDLVVRLQQTRIPPHSEWAELSQRLLAKGESPQNCGVHRPEPVQSINQCVGDLGGF